MRILIQRVSHASVHVAGQLTGAIESGLLVFLGVGQDDSEAQVKVLVDKLVQLRIFEDEGGKMNLSLLAVHGAVLVVSQFTLYADLRRGRRPGFSRAAPPALAQLLYEQFKTAVAAYGVPVASGIFGASMQVELCNNGPVTIWMDSDDLA